MKSKKDLWASPMIISFALAIMSIGAFAELNGNSGNYNRRDRPSTELTADQQKMSKSDADITRRIRKALVKDKSLSLNAKNVKVITINGEVTLKGAVKSEEEELQIVKNANLVAGNTHVINQLEIETDTNK